MPGGSPGACGWGQMVGPTCGLCLALAPEGPHPHPFPARRLAPCSGGLGGSQIRALVVKAWKPWPREGRSLRSRSSTFDVSLTLASRCREAPGAPSSRPGHRRRSPPGKTEHGPGRKWRAASRQIPAGSCPWERGRVHHGLQRAPESRGFPLSAPSALPPPHPPAHAPPAARGSLAAQSRLGHRLFWGHAEGAPAPNCREGKGDGREEEGEEGAGTRKERGQGQRQEGTRAERAERAERLLAARPAALAPRLRRLPRPAQAGERRRANSRRRPAAAGSRSSRPRRSKSLSVALEAGPPRERVPVPAHLRPCDPSPPRLRKYRADLRASDHLRATCPKAFASSPSP